MFYRSKDICFVYLFPQQPPAGLFGVNKKHQCTPSTGQTWVDWQARCLFPKCWTVSLSILYLLSMYKILYMQTRFYKLQFFQPYWFLRVGKTPGDTTEPYGFRPERHPGLIHFTNSQYTTALTTCPLWNISPVTVFMTTARENLTLNLIFTPEDQYALK